MVENNIKEHIWRLETIFGTMFTGRKWSLYERCFTRPMRAFDEQVFH